MNIKVAYFEITNRCNLNCSTCYNRSGCNTEMKQISVNTLRDTIDTFIDFGLNRVLLSGGEPTLHTQFDEILKLIDIYPQLSFGIVTNGTVFSQALIDTFNTSSRLTIQISLDGSSEEINCKTRGNGNFEKSMEFVRKLHNQNEKPLLKMVISQNNYNDIEPFYRLAVSVDAIPEYAFINKQGNGSEDWENKEIAPQQKLKALRLIDRLNDELNIKALLPLCTSFCPLSDNDVMLSLCVKVDGLIQPCQLLYDDIFALGDIYDFDKSKFHNRVVETSMLAKKRKNTDYGCERCIIKNMCERGCMATAFNIYNDAIATDNECEYRKIQFIGYNLKNPILGK